MSETPEVEAFGSGAGNFTLAVSANGTTTTTDAPPPPPPNLISQMPEKSTLPSAVRGAGAGPRPDFCADPPQREAS